jgi:PBP1b-binding outer membrane lipoprotein LpoB
MKSAGRIAALLVLTSACSSEPAPKEAGKAQTAEIKEETDSAVKAEKKSIEEAAEAAVKLVEEESRQEIEGLAPTEAQ